MGEEEIEEFLDVQPKLPFASFAPLCGQNGDLGSHLEIAEAKETESADGADDADEYRIWTHHRGHRDETLLEIAEAKETESADVADGYRIF